MKHELAQKIHEQKYQESMSIDEYNQSLDQGFDLIKTTGLQQATGQNSQAVNLALEYNLELMVSYLSQ